MQILYCSNELIQAKVFKGNWYIFDIFGNKRTLPFMEKIYSPNYITKCVPFHTGLVTFVELQSGPWKMYPVFNALDILLVLVVYLMYYPLNSLYNI